MLEGKTVDDLRAIAMAGGGLDINGAAFTTDNLRAIAMAGTAAGSQLIIRNSNSKTTDDLRAIAISGRGRVTFA